MYINMQTLAGIIMAMSYSAYFLSDYTHNRDQHRDKFTDNELRSLWRELYLMGVSTVCFILSSLNLWLYCHSVEFYWKTRNAIYVISSHFCDFSVCTLYTWRKLFITGLSLSLFCGLAPGDIWNIVHCFRSKNFSI